MIKFFRKIRQKLLTENKFSKYLLYAIGEILLVVIGILIALNVNNFNENRKQEAKIIEALKEIHRDLSDDIKESNGVITSYKNEDSIINVLMTKKMSAEDYKGNNLFNYIGVASTIYSLNINNNGFEKLMVNSDNIPEKYQHLVESLKNIYINDNNELVSSLKLGTDDVTQYLSYLKQNTDWYSEFIYNYNLTEDAINYFLNDSYYKNHLAQYYILSIRNYYADLYQFRIDAEVSYQELTNILQLEDVVASDSTYYNINVKDYDHFLGTYKDSTSTAVISMESDKLYYKWKDADKARLFPVSKSSFMQANDASFNIIVLDSTGHTQGHNWHFGSQKGTMKKTE